MTPRRFAATLAALTMCCTLGPAPAAARSGPVRGSAPRDVVRAVSPTGGARWVWPLAPRPRVVRAFDPPSARWSAGHRGIDLAAAAGDQVLAVDQGLVTHVGVIAGRGTVSVLHASGVRSTYEPVDGVVHEGEHVSRGEVVGVLSGPAGHYAAADCLHLGARRGDRYLDPMTFLTRPKVILLPPLP